MINLLRTAVPAIVRDIMTIKLVRKANVQNTKCVFFPNLALMTCRKVFAPGALILSIMERMENMMIWMVAPPAYQYGPLMPYLLATVEDWSNVADQVHCDTIVVAVNPIDTLPPDKMIQSIFS